MPLRMAQATGALLLAWPLLIWFAVTYDQLHWILPGVALMLLRLVFVRPAGFTPLRRVTRLAAVTAAGLALASVLLRTHDLLLYYPVAVNALMLMLFAGSLFSGMPIVEQIARCRTPDLPVAAIAYTRRVTQVWSVFFVVNGAIALATCLANDLAYWALWNGAIAYGLMGLLMAGEWLVRQSFIEQAKK
jgi:uncharacterized membrane protein